MMGIMKDDYFEEDQPLEDVKRDWNSGDRVLVIPSELRRRLRHGVARLRDIMAADLRRAADRVGSSLATRR
jgi:hypothetical protein